VSVRPSVLLDLEPHLCVLDLKLHLIFAIECLFYLLDFLFVDGNMDVDETSKDVARIMVVNKTKDS
jgi:hypothetical protein